jgi:hypothetical protein
MVGPKGNYATLSESMVTASFCKALGQALHLTIGRLSIEAGMTPNGPLEWRILRRG